MIPLIILAIEDENDKMFMIALYNQYNRLAYSVASKIVQRETDAEDITQDVFAQIIEKDKIPLLRTFSKQQIASYIAEASKNKAINLVRNKAKKSLSFETLEDVLPSNEGMEEIVLHSLSLEELRIALQTLREDMRELLFMKYYLVMNDEEIGNTLGIKPSSVRMKLTRARREVMQILENKGQSGI